MQHLCLTIPSKAVLRYVCLNNQADSFCFGASAAMSRRRKVTAPVLMFLMFWRSPLWKGNRIEKSLK
ncbi:hypothetical protein GOODEAATRI_029073 [Goodea atripinnis]|uniref:Uncharacterized protein n=1 Tax=Goodea atripinnis TaxID=208336 RepID=A0ABV0MLM9_9TELE